MREQFLIIYFRNLKMDHRRKSIKVYHDLKTKAKCVQDSSSRSGGCSDCARGKTEREKRREVKGRGADCEGP